MTINEDFCDVCGERLPRTPKFDQSTGSLRYKCLNEKCGHVNGRTTVAEKRKSMLRLTPLDKKLIKGEISYASERARR